MPSRFRISIHAAREGGDRKVAEALGMTPAFQSTPPVKAATISGVKTHSKHDISIHAAREGGDMPKFCCTVAATISIHAAREGGDEYIP